MNERGKGLNGKEAWKGQKGLLIFVLLLFFPLMFVCSACMSIAHSVYVHLNDQ